MTNEEYFSSQEFLEQLKIYEDALKEGRSVYLEMRTLTDIAEYYNDNYRVEEALRAVDTAIDMFPGATLPLLMRARYAMIVKKDISESYQYLERVEDKKDLDYIYSIGEILLVQNKIEEAAEHLRKELEKVDEDDREDLVLDSATLYVEYGMMDEAEKWLELAEDQNGMDYRELKAQIAIGKGEFAEGEKIFRKLLDEDPYYTPYWNQLASSQFMDNRIKEGIESSEFSIAINPDDDEALLNKAQGMTSLGKHNEALAYYEKYHELHQNDETGELYLGEGLNFVQRYDEGLQHLRKAEEMAAPDSPNRFDIYKDMAFALSKLERPNEALEYVDKMIALDKENEAELIVYKGHVMLESLLAEEAQKYYTQAMKMSQNSPHIMYRIAVSLYDCGMPDVALITLLSMFGEADENWAFGHAYYAMCCRKMGREKEFVEALKRACELNPGEARIVLGHIFPENVEPQDYYEYYITHQNKEK